MEATQNAVANGDTRTISLYHSHTREKIQITFKRNGRYDTQALKQLNWFLRDWRLDEPTRMDPRLFDIVWEVYREVGATQNIVVVSAYRSLRTNNMLRSRSSGVAKFSQHTQGRAMDFYVPGVNIARLREAGLRLQRGGVGFYPTANSPFVHMDAGNVRHWPRMTRQQLARVFPDGRTVHVPTDGRPLANYALALADAQRAGVHVNDRMPFYTDGRGQQLAAANTGRKRGFLQRMFGDDEEDESAAPADERYALLSPRRTRQDELRAGTPAAPAPVDIPVPAEPAPAVAESSMPVTTGVEPPMPVPEARPAAEPVQVVAKTDEVPLPSPRMMTWTTGVQSASLATEAPQTGVAAPALPVPRPGYAALPPALLAQAPAQNGLGSTVTAFASEPQITLPMLRPAGLDTRSAAAAQQAIQQAAVQQPARQRQHSLVTSPRTPRDHILQAYAASAISTASLPAELMPIRLDAKTVRIIFAPVRSISNKTTALQHPDQNHLQNLMALPTAALQARFGSNPMNGLRMDRFEGGAVAFLLSYTFVPLDGMEATASITRR